MTINQAVDRLKQAEVYLSIDTVPEHYKSNGIEEHRVLPSSY